MAGMILNATVLKDAPGRPLLLLGPSVGTTAETLWARCAARMRGDFHVVGWDLPGHGRSAPATSGYTLGDLASAVLALADGRPFHYAGDSIGGAVGLQLLLDAPDRVLKAAVLCTGAKIGEPAAWHERAALVRDQGIEAVVAGSIERWFGPGFRQREPSAAEALLGALRATDPESYAYACEALALFDVRAELSRIEQPVLAVAGAHDKPTPVAGLRLIADEVLDGRLVVLDGVAHLAPAELPSGVAALLDGHFGGDEGTAVRRAVLGDAHVDRSQAGTTDFTREFQDFITAYAWGGIWTRPGLDRRSRSMITLTALVALGHQEELAMHVRAARTNGLTDDEIKEVLLQAAVYCGVPAANTAFRIAQKVLAE
jgi:3-oxoadipate enol-lactonase/4-carboxymuconolactone decarboxylase